MTYSTFASPGASLQGGSSGSGGAPGGSNTQLQYNNAGAFAGASGLTTDGTSLAIASGSLTMSGNISSAAWTTNGIRFKGVAATFTDTTSSGTVSAAYTNVYGGNTIAASNVTTFTDYYTTFINAPIAGTNVTLTNRWALGIGGNLKLGSDASGTNQAGTAVTVGGSRGTGTGAGGSIVFQVAPAGSSGSTPNALADALTISGTRLATFTGDVGLYSSNTLRIGASSVNWQITASTTGIIQGAANYYGFFSSTNVASAGSVDARVYRDDAGIVGLRGASTTTPGAMSFYTYGASPPAAPAASIVRLYADTSGGKIRLMALFPTGAAQQIAIEP